MRRSSALLLAAMVLLPRAAFAHAEEGVAAGFLSGFAHPISGFDHIVAMVKKLPAESGSRRP